MNRFGVEAKITSTHFAKEMRLSSRVRLVIFEAELIGVAKVGVYQLFSGRFVVITKTGILNIPKAQEFEGKKLSLEVASEYLSAKWK